MGNPLLLAHPLEDLHLFAGGRHRLPDGRFRLRRLSPLLTQCRQSPADPFPGLLEKGQLVPGQPGGGTQAFS